MHQYVLLFIALLSNQHKWSKSKMFGWPVIYMPLAFCWCQNHSLTGQLVHGNCDLNQDQHDHNINHWIELFRCVQQALWCNARRDIGNGNDIDLETLWLVGYSSKVNNFMYFHIFIDLFGKSFLCRMSHASTRRSRH